MPFGAYIVSELNERFRSINRGRVLMPYGAFFDSEHRPRRGLAVEVKRWVLIPYEAFWGFGAL